MSILVGAFTVFAGCTGVSTEENAALNEEAANQNFANGGATTFVTTGAIAEILSADVTAAAATPAVLDDTPRTIATIRFASASFKLEDGRTCQITGFPGNPVCQPVEEPETPDDEISTATTTDTTSDTSTGRTSEPPAEPTQADFQIKVIHHPGMSCGLHYGDYKWQKRFDVALEGTPAAMQQVKSVSYNVFDAYQGNENGFLIETPGNGFATSVGFLTPILSWSTGPATVTLKSGTTLEVGPGQINWQDEDPEKPAGQPCTP